MSGITGFWNRDGRPADGSVLQAMSAVMSHRGVDGEGRWVRGAAGFACQRFHVTPESAQERQPVVGPSGSVIVFDGRLDNRETLVARLGLRRQASDRLPDVALVLAAYEAWGVPFLDALLGDFAFAIYDPRESRLVLGRDAIGLRPMYYRVDNGLVAFASEVKALLRHPGIPSEPDRAGLTDFMMLGIHSLERQERTCFAGIAALVPAHVAVVEPDRVTVRRYWDFDRHRRLGPRSHGAWVEEFGERFATAVQRRIRTTAPVAISVSGGLDSSSIFCQAETLRRAGKTSCPGVIGVSYSTEDGSDADEREYLGEIERRYQVGIERIAVEPHVGVREGAEDQAWHIEAPFPDYLWLVTKAVQESARRGGARVLLSGHWGDQVLFSTGYLVDLTRRFAWRAVTRHLKEYRRWFHADEVAALRRHFLTDLVRYHTPRALVAPLKWLRRRIAPDPHRDSVYTPSFRAIGLALANRPAYNGGAFHHAHAQSLYLQIRSKYAVMCMDWNNKAAAIDGLDAAFPMLDRDLLEFLVAAPGEIQNRGGVPRVLLRDAMRGILPDAIVGRTWKADFSAPVNRGVESDFPQIERELSADALMVRRGYVEPEALAQALAHARANLRSDDLTAAWNVTDLLGFELWLRVFFGGPGAGGVR